MALESLFLHIVNISLVAGFVALAVMLLRLLFAKAPKWIYVIMWALVGVRLICPFSFESDVSVVPSAEPIPGEILYTQTPEISTGIQFINSGVNPIISESLSPDPTASINPTQVIAFVGSVIWLVGIAAMLIYTLVCCIRIRSQVREAVNVKDDIWICDNVSTPFIFGVIKPKIYIPSSIAENSLEHVIAHEKAHIKRCDHLWKPFGFALLTVYWFNPILWLAYILLCRDIEAACDEKVIKNMSADGKAEYSNALIDCSSPRRIISACPIAFGETNIKGRINNVLNYKKPTFWIILIALVACIVASVCLLTNPPDDDILSTNISYSSTDNDLSGKLDGVDTAPLDMIAMTYRITADIQYFEYDATYGIDVYVTKGSGNNYYYRLAEHKQSGCDHSGKAVNTYIDALDARNAAIVLSIYGLDDSKINYIPYEDAPEDCISEAKAAVKSASLVPAAENEQKRVLSRAMFDIDGDGKDEYLVAHRVNSSNADDSYVAITAIDPQTKMPKEITSCSLDAYEEVKFIDHDDGKLYINGVIDGRFFEYALEYRTSVYRSYLSVLETVHLPSLRKMYPEYFEFDAKKGIDVYCKCDYPMTLQLVQHKLTGQSDSDIDGMPTLTFGQATVILSTYNIKISDIHVKTIYSDKTHTPPASTLGISKEARDESIERYVIERLTSNGVAYPLIDEIYYYDFLIFDADNDGREEKCLLQYVFTSGVFYVDVKIAEFGADGLEYEGSVQSYWSYPYFIKDSDGKVYVNVDDTSGENKYYYEISVSDEGKITFKQAKVTPLTLYDLYPQYMNLDASKGLDVIVWQMNETYYLFGLLPHKDGEYGLVITELMNESGVNAGTMRRILDDYGIDDDDIYIVPWQNPVSSYIPDYFKEDGKNTDEYIDNIKAMLEID